MDDAFAGGVCRCQHCGTIQTVPSRLKGSGRPSSPNATGQKALYAGAGNTAGGMSGGAIPSSGLDDLATAVASSSGLSNNLTGRSSPGIPAAPVSTGRSTPRAKAPNKMPLYLALGGCGVLVIVVVILLMNRGGGDKPTPTNSSGNPNASQNGGGTTPGGGQTPTVVTPASKLAEGPRFLTLSLSASKVVYVTDRGSTMANAFDPLKDVLADSVNSLGSNAKFKVVFWTSGGLKDNPNEYAYPKGKLTSANSGEVEKLRKELEDVPVGGATDIGPAIKEAVSQNPDVIIIVTAKDRLNLDDANFVNPIKKALGTKKIPINTISLTDSGDPGGPLETIAKTTGGQYINIRPSELKLK
jgi:hypothetical protein